MGVTDNDKAEVQQWISYAQTTIKEAKDKAPIAKVSVAINLTYI